MKSMPNIPKRKMRWRNNRKPWHFTASMVSPEAAVEAAVEVEAAVLEEPPQAVRASAAADTPAAARKLRREIRRSNFIFFPSLLPQCFIEVKHWMVKNAQRLFAPPSERCTPLCDIRIIRCSAWKGKASGCFSVLWPMVSKNFVFVFVQFWRYTVVARNTVSRKHEFFVFFGGTDEEISPAYFHFLCISRTFNLFLCTYQTQKIPAENAAFSAGKHRSFGF